jgi:hypothetical protein
MLTHELGTSPGPGSVAAAPAEASGQQRAPAFQNALNFGKLLGRAHTEEFRDLSSQLRSYERAGSSVSRIYFKNVSFCFYNFINLKSDKKISSLADGEYVH